MKLNKPTDREVWDAMDVLSRAISHKARETIKKRGGDENIMADHARAASMDLSNTIKNIFNKYES